MLVLDLAYDSRQTVLDCIWLVEREKAEMNKRPTAMAFYATSQSKSQQMNVITTGCRTSLNHLKKEAGSSLKVTVQTLLFHLLTSKKANRRRKLTTSPGFVN